VKDIESNTHDIDLLKQSKPLSEREKTVLNLYLSGLPLSEAVKQAGYKAKHPQTRCIIGNRILRKYESQAGGKEIFRRAGLGEARLAAKLRRLIEHLEERVYDRGELAAATKLLKGLELASKCLGLQREVVEGLEAPILVIGGDAAAEAEVRVRQAEIRARIVGRGRGVDSGQDNPG